MTTPIMKMRDYNQEDNRKDYNRNFGDGKNHNRGICGNRVCSGIVVGDSYTQSGINRLS